MDLPDDLLMAIYLADNVMGQEGVGLGWGQGSFDIDVTPEVEAAWQEAVRAGTQLWLSRHSHESHPWVDHARRWLNESEGDAAKEVG